MAKLTRRGFLLSSAGAATGAVAAGALTLRPLGAAARAASEAGGAATTEPVVAYIRNGSRGEIRLMIGTREVTYNDPRLVRRLLEASR